MGLSLILSGTIVALLDMPFALRFFGWNYQVYLVTNFGWSSVLLLYFLAFARLMFFFAVQKIEMQIMILIFVVLRKHISG